MADNAVVDPIGAITALVVVVEDRLAPGRVRAIVSGVVGGRAKSRQVAVALAASPSVLLDGRSPAPRAIGDLLIALREAGARSIAAPRCAECDKPLRTLQRRGQDWYCAVCGPRPEECAVCGDLGRITTRDRSGRPRCQRCPEEDQRDPVVSITDQVTALDPAVDPQAVAAAVRTVAARPTHQRRLAWALEDNPALLTGDGHLAPIPAVLRLIDLLCDGGVNGVVRPVCPCCHRAVRIAKPLNGQRVCRNCIAKSRIEQCSRCDARREPATRDERGQPICPNCLVNDPANLETCVGCGRQRRVHTRSPQGPLCGTCKSLPALDCFICGTTAPCGISRATGLPWCWSCQRRSVICSACGRHSPIVSGTLSEPLCADCTPLPRWRDCPTCSDPDHPHPGQCARCQINRRLDEVMGPVNDSLPAGLQALRRNIATAEHPITAMRWLTKPSIAPVLADLATGQLPLTHQALDELPHAQPLAHLRQTLVAVGALPERDEHMIRLEGFLADLLVSQQDPEQRQTLRRYTTWHLARRLRTRNNGRPATPQQCRGVRQRAQAAVAFLDWLRGHDLTLGTCRQGDLDHWLTDNSATYRKTAGHFIRWARSHKLTTVHAPAIRWTGPTQPLDDQRRWELARRLLHDDHLKPEDRLAGLLLLLYAQTAAVISRLTVNHLDADPQRVRLRLGTAPIDLPEPIAELARTVVANRKGHATIGALAPSSWLFPGGQPGRPISTAQLTHRLNNLGVRPNQARNTALLQLATEIPAAILARTLGIHTDVAVAWQRHSAGDWAAYAADVSRRNLRHSDSSNT
jgi:hypothetical protein